MDPAVDPRIKLWYIAYGELLSGLYLAFRMSNNDSFIPMKGAIPASETPRPL
jgi:hypothetical protein